MYTAADFELDKRHVIKNEKVALDRLEVPQNVFLVKANITVDGCQEVRHQFHSISVPSDLCY